MHDLQRTVVHLVRTATTEADRRRHRRRPCFVEATVSLQGRSVTASLQDISERGCYAVTDLHAQPGQRVDIALSRFDIRLAGTTMEQSEDGLHIGFVGDGLAATEADRISLASVTALVEMAKGDHTAFVKRVVDIVAAGEKLPPDTLASPHHCRFGRWYDNVSDSAAIALPSFKAIKQPHEAVHELVAGTQRYVSDMRSQSEAVLRCLDAFARDYPTTLARKAA